MSTPSTHHCLCLLLALLLQTCALAENDLVLISNPTREPTDFQMIARSRSAVVRGGSGIQLTCRTNQPWYLCSWVQPGGEECHRIVTDKYSTSCHSNDRIRFEVYQSRYLVIIVISIFVPCSQKSIRGEDCTIHIDDLQTSDSGSWKCILKDEVHADHKEVSTLEVTVAKPYDLTIDPDEVELDLRDLEEGQANNTTEVICKAVGGGSVDPEVTWQLNGVIQTEEHTRQWEVKFFYQP